MQCYQISLADIIMQQIPPYLFTREDASLKEFKIRTIADISCDINGPIASTIRSSKIKDPIYGYNTITQLEDVFNIEEVITVMAVDNLPGELPKILQKILVKI